jgi:hypothetical protein
MKWRFLPNRIRTEVLPLSDELLVDRVILVEVREDLFLPRPLDHRRFEQRGRSVAVELEHLGIAAAVEPKIEAAIVESRRLIIP